MGLGLKALDESEVMRMKSQMNKNKNNLMASGVIMEEDCDREIEFLKNLAANKGTLTPVNGRSEEINAKSGNCNIF